MLHVAVAVAVAAALLLVAVATWIWLRLPPLVLLVVVVGEILAINLIDIHTCTCCSCEKWLARVDVSAKLLCKQLWKNMMRGL